MDGLLSSLDDPALALVQWNEVYGVVQDRLPAAVAVELEACVTGRWGGVGREGGRGDGSGDGRGDERGGGGKGRARALWEACGGTPAHGASSWAGPVWMLSEEVHPPACLPACPPSRVCVRD